MNALTVTHSDPAAAEVFAPTLEVLKADVAGKAAALVAYAGFDITGPESFQKANDMATVMHATEKEIEARRAYLKRPLIDVGKAIERAVDGVAGPLSTARKALIGKIAAWDRRQKEIAAEAARAAAAKAEQERAAAQKLVDDEHAKVVAAAKAKAEADAKELADIIGAPVEPEPVKVAPPVVVQAATPAPVAAPLVPSAVTTRMVPELVIDDERQVAAAFKVGDEVLVTINRAAVKRVLDAGGIVPGARIVVREQVAQKAVRT